MSDRSNQTPIPVDSRQSTISITRDRLTLAYEINTNGESETGSTMRCPSPHQRGETFSFVRWSGLGGDTIDRFDLIDHRREDRCERCMRGAQDLDRIGWL